MNIYLCNKDAAIDFQLIIKIVKDILPNHSNLKLNTSYDKGICYIIEDEIKAIDITITIYKALVYFDWKSTNQYDIPKLNLIISDEDITNNDLHFEYNDVFPINIIIKNPSDNIRNHCRRFEFQKLDNHNGDILLKTKGIIGIEFYDDQFNARQISLRKFSIIWLLLDQLPWGGWGKSVNEWMSSVWQNMPGFVPDAFMEKEGGFETTILNLDLLTTIIGYDKIISNEFFIKALRYLADRQSKTNGGLGTKSFSRQGAEIHATPRHTSLAVLFAIKQIQSNSYSINKILNEILKKGIKYLSNCVNEEYFTDRNPLLLFMTLWNINNSLGNNKISNYLDKKTIKAFQLKFQDIEPELANTFSLDSYTGEPNQEKRTIYSLFPPYGMFIRMETYTLLTSACFINAKMHPDILSRYKNAINYIIRAYMEGYDQDKPDKLHQKIHGVRPHFSKEIKNEKLDVGCTSLLLRVIRDTEIISAIYTKEEINSLDLAKIKYLLHEDLANSFDKYLENPGIYNLTNAGMLASFLACDNKKNLLNNILNFDINDFLSNFSTEISDDNLTRILSEKTIEEIVLKSIYEIDNLKVQLSVMSLVRLLQDRLKPGTYINENSKNLTSRGRIIISKNTLNTYKNPHFADKFNKTWGNKLDHDNAELFLKMLKPNSKILDVGSGPGHYASRFIDKGHVVELIDGSNSLLEIAQKNIKKISDLELVTHNVINPVVYY